MVWKSSCAPPRTPSWLWKRRSSRRRRTWPAGRSVFRGRPRSTRRSSRTGVSCSARSTKSSPPRAARFGSSKRKSRPASGRSFAACWKRKAGSRSCRSSATPVPRATSRSVPRPSRSSAPGGMSCTAIAASGFFITIRRRHEPGIGKRGTGNERIKSSFVLRFPFSVFRSMKFRASIDGAARNNPGPAGAGVYVEPEGDRPAEEIFEPLGSTTNNVAEYRALLLALTRAEELGADEVEIRSDSRLMVEQVNGKFRVKAEHLKPLMAEAVTRAKRFRRFSLTHIARERNTQADRLANLGADASELTDAGP